MGKKKKRKKKEIYTYEKSPKVVRMPGTRKISGKSWAVMGVAILILCIFLLVLDRYTVKTITVEGNIHYTNDEIVDMVIKNRLDHNSLYLSNI